MFFELYFVIWFRHAVYSSQETAVPDIAMRLGRDMLTLEGDVADILHEQGLPDDECIEFANVLDPEMVEDVHRYFHMAGVTCSISNTYGTSRARLERFGLADRVSELGLAGVRAASKARPQHVLAAMGPCGLAMAPRGACSFEQVFSQYLGQASSFAGGRPDAILIEDMRDIADARAAVLAVRYSCGLPAFVCCSFDERGLMPSSDTTPEAAAVILEAAGAAAIGVNGPDPEQPFPAFERMAASTALPLVAYVDAGTPLQRAGRAIGPLSPDAAANQALRYRAAGAQMFGIRHGGTYAQAGAIAATIDLLEVLPRVGVPRGIMLATPHAVFPFVEGASLEDLVPCDGSSVPMEATMPLLLQCPDETILERVLKLYPGRPLVDLRDCDEEILADRAILAWQYGAVSAVSLPDGVDVSERWSELRRLGLSGHDAVLVRGGRCV